MPLEAKSRQNNYCHTRIQQKACKSTLGEITLCRFFGGWLRHVTTVTTRYDRYDTLRKVTTVTTRYERLRPLRHVTKGYDRYDTLRHVTTRYERLPI